MTVLRLGMSLLLAGSLLCAQKKAVEEANAKSLALVGKPAPAFHLADLNQNTFDLAERRGEVIVLAFWATWCPPCRSEMATLARLQKEWETSKVAVVPVAFDHPAKARAFLAKKPIGLWSLADENGSVAALYGARALPKTFIINREGTVVKALIGKLSEAALREAVDAASTDGEEGQRQTAGRFAWCKNSFRPPACSMAVRGIARLS